MKALTFTTILLGILFRLFVFPVSAQAYETVDLLEHNYSVKNVRGAFENIAKQGEWLGFYLDRHSKEN
jgi:hypothetical protein